MPSLSLISQMHRGPQAVLASLCRLLQLLQHSRCTPELDRSQKLSEWPWAGCFCLSFPSLPVTSPCALGGMWSDFPPPAEFVSEAGDGFSIYSPWSMKVLEMKEAEGEHSPGRGAATGTPVPEFAAPPRQETSKRARHPLLPASGSLNALPVQACLALLEKKK